MQCSSNHHPLSGQKSSAVELALSEPMANMVTTFSFGQIPELNEKLKPASESTGSYVRPTRQ
jgi:hypothetical protein